MKHHLQITGNVKTLSPLTHGTDIPDEGVKATRNTLFHRKMKVFYKGEPVLVPVVSGNSIRGIMRRLGADSFLELIGLHASDIDAKLHYLLYSGGGLEKSKKHPEIEELQRYIPLISLMGASIGNMVIPGKVDVDFLIPHVNETAPLFNQEEPGITVEQIKGWLQYSRNDDLHFFEDEKPNQMIYRMEYIAPNVDLRGSFSLKGTTELETSLFVHLLNRLRNHGHLGGKNSRGHGKVAFDFDVPQNLSEEGYIDYVSSHKEAILDFLRSNWTLES